MRHHKVGWLKDDLIAAGKLVDSKPAIHAKIWQDYNSQLLYIRAQQDIMGPDFNPLRVMPARNLEGKFAFTNNVDVPKNYLSLTYLLYAYDINATTFKRLRLRGGEPLEKQVPHNKGQTVLTDGDFAASIYSPRYFYVQAQIKTWSKANPQASSKRKSERRKLLSKEWDQKKAIDEDFGKACDKKVVIILRVKKERKRKWLPY